VNCARHISLQQVAFLILLLGHVCAAQNHFWVSNPTHQEWQQEEADRIYISIARDLAAEFKRGELAGAVFTLVLGANENSVDMNNRELRLKKWNKYLYAEGVVRLTFDQLLSTESKMRLAKRAVIEADSTVDVHKNENTTKQNASSEPGAFRKE